jgi:hypothetical protein
MVFDRFDSRRGFYAWLYEDVWQASSPRGYQLCYKSAGYPVIADTSNRSAPWVPREKNERSIVLRKKITMMVLLSLIAGTLMAQEVKVTPLMS